MSNQHNLENFLHNLQVSTLKFLLSKMLKRKETLAETISGVLNTVPETFDNEDDNYDNTKAEVIKDFGEEDDKTEEQLLSVFRKKNVDLLSDIDSRYSGKKASRDSLVESNEDDENDFELPEEISEGDESGLSEEEISEEEEETSSDGPNIEEDDNFQQIQQPNSSMMNRKGVCVRNQLRIWENLLEIRIQLQKCLLTGNKMPQSENFNEIKTASGEEFMNNVSKTRNNLSNLLDKMLTLQNLISNNNSASKGENSDEEITSDSETSNHEEENNVLEESSPKKRKLSNYEEILNKNHKNYANHRDATIRKWYDKTRLAVNKNNSVQHTVLDQINYHLSDKEKLIKRTQLKRSNYEILGLKNETDKNDETESKEEYNKEIFDDDDFYHQLLRELIELKSSDITDPVQLGRQWIQLQNMRSKMKRKIDTRATKGRKIRYVVHNKLVNFMAPYDENLWTEEAKTELYNTLFGKKR